MRHAGAAATVEIMLLGAASVEESLPELPKVRVDEGVVVSGSRKRVGKGGAATSAVACPHQTVLFVVAKVLALRFVNTL